MPNYVEKATAMGKPIQLDEDDLLTLQKCLCPAKRLRNLKLGRGARSALAQGRLLVLSCFAEEARRMTAAQARIRNDMVAALSSSLFVPHASPGGKTWLTVYQVLQNGGKAFTLDDDSNAALVAAGAKVCRSGKAF